jgi:addiction module HigA family antidote
MLPKNRKPSHPGEILKYEYLEPLGMSESQLSVSVGIPLDNMKGLVRGENSVTSDIAFRLARFFGTSAEFWLNLQRNVDMWDTLRIHCREYEKIIPFSGHHQNICEE